MGVKGLWPLLEPVGRRVNIEALTNKCLAVGGQFLTCYPTPLALLTSLSSLIAAKDPHFAGAVCTGQCNLEEGVLTPSADASIWVHQFIKTMRAADGEVLRNAHLLGFFRRICKYAPISQRAVQCLPPSHPSSPFALLKQVRLKESPYAQATIQSHTPSFCL